MRRSELSRRLSAAFELVRDGEVVVDIGTDHAYLPMALVDTRKCPSAYASDIGKGPLEIAKKNIEKEKLEHKITTVLTDGAAYFDGLAREFIIAGMGGELIYRIISDAPFLKSPDIHLVLQPMTKIDVLRKLLSADGFYTQREKLVEEDGKIYTVMSVFYDGVSRELSDADAITGSISDAVKDGNGMLLSRLIQTNVNKLTTCVGGKLKAGESVNYENTLIEELLKKQRQITGAVTEKVIRSYENKGNKKLSE